MNFPAKIRATILTRFDSLLAEGGSILATAENIPAKYGYNELTNRQYESEAAYKKLDWSRYVEWRTKSATLLSYVLPKDHIHRPSADTLLSVTATQGHLEWALSLLKGIKNDLESGFLDDLSSQIEAEIAADYMGQAEQLLHEGQKGKFDHIPAAVLSGAVLEKSLRQLCQQQQPKISIISQNGDHKTLGPLIDDLKKAGLFNELKAKQLRAWADIRNKAAHGDFDQFSRSDVEQMIAGISTFLSEFLK
jgi:hypothetical protein